MGTGQQMKAHDTLNKKKCLQEYIDNIMYVDMYKITRSTICVQYDLCTDLCTCQLQDEGTQALMCDPSPFEGAPGDGDGAAVLDHGASVAEPLVDAGLTGAQCHHAVLLDTAPSCVQHLCRETTHTHTPLCGDHQGNKIKMVLKHYPPFWWVPIGQRLGVSSYTESETSTLTSLEKPDKKRWQCLI